MKKFGLAGAAFVALCAGAASAADLPSRKDAPVEPPPVWTGFYAGLNAGYGWGATSAVTTTPSAVSDWWANNLNDEFAGTPNAAFATPGAASRASAGVARVEQRGFIGGGQIGYNVQLNSSLVAGLEIDMQGAGFQGGGGGAGMSRDGFSDNASLSLTRIVAGASQYSAGVDWLGTVRGRLGWLATPTLLVYGAGGFAFGGAHASATHMLGGRQTLVDGPVTQGDAFATFGGVGRFSNTQTGWTAGGGLEWMIAPNWSLKAEALYYDLGSAQFTASPVGALASANRSTIVVFAAAPVTRLRFDGVIARAGVNYHLNWGSAPVIAKF